MTWYLFKLFLRRPFLGPDLGVGGQFGFAACQVGFDADCLRYPAGRLARDERDWHEMDRFGRVGLWCLELEMEVTRISIC